MRSGGGRVTGVRRALLDALVDAGAHRTADELAGKVRSTHPDAHLSTVYRSLDSLERLGIVDHIHLGHGRTVYHLADDDHQHLVCERCAAVIDIPKGTFSALSARLLREQGFVVHPHHVALTGLCARCAPRVSVGGRGSAPDRPGTAAGRRGSAPTRRSGG